MYSSIKRSFGFIKFSLCVLLILFAVSCGQNETPEAPVEYKDSQITEAVSADLFIARGVNDEAIEVETENGIVTLRGTVESILSKERAARIAQSVKGVRSVINAIIVMTDISDEQVSKNVKMALNEDPATEDFEVTTTVQDNTVTLSGVVDSWQEKQLAATVVKGVDGVQEVVNNITVNYEADRTDAEIKENVKYALKWDARISDMLINVSVNDDVVTLTGSVGSAYEKQLASNVAHTAGVKKVDASQLKVEPWARDEMQRKVATLDPSDQQIEEAILDVLSRDPRVSPFEISVNVEDGVVTLSGEVDNLKAKRAAVRDVQNTMGVRRVNQALDIENQIVVTASVDVDAGQIKQNIVQAIRQDPYVDTTNVSVSVEEGSVTLTGNVETYFEKLQAGNVASTVNGVESITNNITVAYEPFAFDRPLSGWNPILDDVDFRVVEKDDNTLKQDVISQITWSPYINIDDVSVSVNNGVVTLSGQVDSWFEYNKAIEEAYEAGALKVKNELTYMNS